MSKREFMMAIRVLRSGRFRFFWLIVKRSVKGLLSTKCRQCGKPKPRSAYTNCAGCQLKNLGAELFDDEHYFDVHTNPGG